jgi:acyl dehydratase
VQIGDAAPPHLEEVTGEVIARFCRNARYENPIYNNEGAARGVGLPGVIAPPAMVLFLAPARLAQVAESRGCALPDGPANGGWAFSPVCLSIEFQGNLIVPGDTVTSITSVENKFQGDDGRFVTFLVKAENQRGEPVANYRQTFAWPESRS